MVEGAASPGRGEGREQTLEGLRGEARSIAAFNRDISSCQDVINFTANSKYHCGINEVKRLPLTGTMLKFGAVGQLSYTDG